MSTTFVHSGSNDTLRRSSIYSTHFDYLTHTIPSDALNADIPAFLPGQPQTWSATGTNDAGTLVDPADIYSITHSGAEQEWAGSQTMGRGISYCDSSESDQGHSHTDSSPTEMANLDGFDSYGAHSGHWDSSPGSSSLSYHSDTGSIPHGQPVSFLMHASMRPSFFVEHQRHHEAPKCINLDQLLGAGTEAEAAEAEFAGPLRSKRPSTVSNPGTEAPVEYIIEDEDADAEGEDEISISEDVDAERDEGRWSSASISHTPSELSEYRPSASPPAEDIHTKNSSPSGRYHPYSTIGRKSRVKNDSSSSSTSSETRTTRKRTVSSERDRSTSNVGVPIPVPNLTKKSRGRKVPTAFNSQNLDSPAQSDEEYPSNGSVRRGRGRGRARKTGPSSARRDTNRTYRCEVEECGKCFVRGEHLKRHIRSIHTNEKPHPCPHEGCDRTFSRRDNLAQHQRVHER